MRKRLEENAPLILAIVLIITAIVFSPTLKNQFTNWDDPTHVLNNPHVQSLNLKEIFTTSINRTYIPLTIFSFGIDHAIFGFNPFFFHLINLLLHLIVVALVYVFAYQCGLNKVASGLAALLFAIHPIHLEPVAWITARKDLLYSAFYLLALIFYTWYINKKSSRDYVLSIIFALLSVLAKPMALSLPLIFLVCDMYFERPKKINLLIEKIPHFLVIAPISWITYAMNARNPIQNISDAPIIWISCLVFYIKKFFLPLHLHPLYQFPFPVSIGNMFYLSSIILFGALIWIILHWREKSLFIFAISFYFLSCFFLFRFDVGQDMSIVADRFMYLPSVGFCLLIGSNLYRLLNKIQESKIIIIVGISIIFILLGTKTFIQAPIWKNSQTLWNYVIENYPKTAIAYNNRGYELLQNNAYQLAIKDFDQAIKLNPQYDKAYLNRGIAFSKLNNPKRALVDFNHSMQLNDKETQGYYHRATIYIQMGKLGDAQKDLGIVLAKDPRHVEALVSLGVLNMTAKNYSIAIKHFDKAIAIDPKNIEGYVNKGLISFLKKDFKAAIDFFNQAEKINPKHKGVYFSRGAVYFEQKNYEKALENLDKAIKLDSFYAAAYKNRSSIHAAMGNIEKAISDAEKARSLGAPIDPRYFEALRTLQNQKFDFGF